MYSYSAYQLCLHSEIPLSDLPVADGAPDIIVRLKRTNTLLATVETVNSSQEVFGHLEGIGNCWFSHGRFITIEPFENVSHDMIAPNILGGCMSISLRQRGFLVLHASSVSVQHSVVAFLGGSGWGKSTLAAALHAQGHNVLTDDVMAIKLDRAGGASKPDIIPSFPQCKLTPEAAAALGKDPAALSPLFAHAHKRAFNFKSGFQTEPLPLQKIYLLAKGQKHSITPVSPKEAFSHLVSHTRAMGVLNDPQSLQSHFQQCTQLLQASAMLSLYSQTWLRRITGFSAFGRGTCGRNIG